MRRFSRHPSFGPVFHRMPFVLRLLAVYLFTSSLACDGARPLPSGPPSPAAPPLADIYDDGSNCPPEGCRAPSPEERDAISQAIDYIINNAGGAGTASSICEEAAAAAQNALNTSGKIMIGNYDGITHWSGTHPTDQWDFTEFGSDLFPDPNDPNAPPPPPPLYRELVIAHEFIHMSQHMHADPYEDQVEALAEQCVFGG